MAVNIKSGAGTDLQTVDPTSKAARVTLYNSAGVEVVAAAPTAIVCNAVTAAGNDMIASFDASIYKYISFQTLGTWVGTLEFQESNDNGTWTSIVVQDGANTSNPYGTEVTSSGRLIRVPILGRYIRVRCTAYTSGTIEAACDAYKQVNSTGQISTTGTVTVDGDVGLAAGSALIGTVGLAAGSELVGKVNFVPANTDPVQHENIISAVGVNATSLKASAGNIQNILIVSAAATPRFFKLYNKASAPVVGTDTPMITIPLATGASPYNVPPLAGIDFSNGIAYAILLGVQDSSTTPFTVAGEVTAQITYS
jgi:hypothetical protein